jgi:hypothetical protein
MSKEHRRLIRDMTKAIRLGFEYVCTKGQRPICRSKWRAIYPQMSPIGSAGKSTSEGAK